jgi:ribosome biogenesis ATPase
MDELRTSQRQNFDRMEKCSKPIFTSTSPITNRIVVLGATNRPESIDPILKRVGKFDHEIALKIPTETAREEILETICRKIRLVDHLDYNLLAKRTRGFVGADLVALTTEAARVAATRILQKFQSRPLRKFDLRKTFITTADFELALGKVKPIARHEGFSRIPDTTWQDVGSLNDVREELEFTILWPIKEPHRFEAMGLQNGSGVLLYGPPGCGKTLVARAVASESRANFVSIKGPELISKYVGESEKAIRNLFSKALAASPCLLFFDELDALAPRRGNGENQAAERLVNQLLTELDGLDPRREVYLIGATNRPDMLDPAILRPGRLDKVVYVPLPTLNGRISILKTLMRKIPMAPTVQLAELAAGAHFERFSGADLKAVVHKACVIAMKEAFGGVQTNQEDRFYSSHLPVVFQRHLVQASALFRPSVSESEIGVFSTMQHKTRHKAKH